MRYQSYQVNSCFDLAIFVVCIIKSNIDLCTKIIPHLDQEHLSGRQKTKIFPIIFNESSLTYCYCKIIHACTFDTFDTYYTRLFKSTGQTQQCHFD